MGSLTDRDCKALVERARKAAEARQLGAPPVTLDASDGNNLLLRAGARGGTWTLRWVVDGKVRGQALGKYPAMGLAAARRAAQDAMVRVRAGLDPLPPPPASAAPAAPAALPAGPTVKDLLDTYMKRKVREGKKPARDPDQVQWVCDRLLVGLHDQLAAELTRKGVTDFLDSTTDKRGAASAYRAGAVLRAAIRFAVARGDLKENPIALLPLPSSGEPRTVTLDDTQLAAVWHSQVPVWSRLARVLLLTGLRLREAADAPVTEVGPDVWLIPMDRMKGKREHAVPLYPRLRVELGDLKDAQWLCKSPRRFQQPAKGFSRGLELLKREAGAEGDWTWHDLRRTVASRLQPMRCPSDVIEVLLAHAAPRIRKTYQTYDYIDERREWMTRWAAWLDALPKPT